MEALQSYYNNLFGIEITVLGIIAAATFVFLQTLYSSFSYKDMTLSLRRYFVWIYAGLSLIVIIVTGIGSMFLTIGAHDFIPFYNLNTKEIFQSDLTAALILCLFILSVIFGIYIVYKSIISLNPSSLIKEHLGNFKEKDLRNFLYKKYGIPAPYPKVTILSYLAEIEEDKKTKDQKKKETEEAELEYEKEKQEYEKLKIEVEKTSEIFDGFIRLVSKAIANGDVSTVKKALDDYNYVIEKVISNTDPKFPMNLLASYIGDTASIFIESCRKHQMGSLSPEFIKSSRILVIKLMETSGQNYIKEILKSWKHIGDMAITNSEKSLFRSIIQSYREVADIAFEKEKTDKENKSDVLDELFRCLGWLAERLLSKKGIEPRPIMYDTDYEDEFGDLYNTLFNFEHKYNFERPDAYPLIFFDAIYVLFAELLNIYISPIDEVQKKMKDYKVDNVKDWLFSCALVYYSFGRNALKAGNSNGVALAAINLKQVYERAVDAKADDVAKDIIGLIVGFSMNTASNPEKMSKGSFLSQPIEKYFESYILNSPYKQEIKKEVNESYLKFDEGSHDKKWEYIKSLGMKMETNFGFMFDAYTGESYPQNDPRRR